MLLRVVLGVAFGTLVLGACGGDDGGGTSAADAGPATASSDAGPSDVDGDGGTTGGSKSDDPAEDGGSGTTPEDAAPPGDDSGASGAPGDATLAPSGTGSIGAVCGADSECGAGQFCLKVTASVSHGTCTIACADNATCADLSTGGFDVMCLEGWWSSTDAQGTTTTFNWQACEFLCGPGQGTCPAGHACQALGTLMICVPQ